MKPVILVSAGDLAGINSLILIRTADKYPDVNFRVVLNTSILKECAEHFHSAIPENIITMEEDCEFVHIRPGRQSEEAYKTGAESLEKSIVLLKQNLKDYAGFITLPLSKYGTSKYIENFAGHTEYLAGKFSSRVAMILYSPEIAVCPVTTHVNITRVESLVTRQAIDDILDTVHSFYKKYLHNDPLFTMLCMNPHCSDNGIMGDSDSNVAEYVKQFKMKYKIKGPVPADSAFTPDSISKTDIFIGMYHDQVLIPFKMLSFDSGINITAGLPFIRVSPDHGPAYDIVESPSCISEKSLLKCVDFILKTI